MELPLLLSGRHLAALKMAAFRQGVTVWRLMRRLIRDYPVVLRERGWRARLVVFADRPHVLLDDLVARAETDHLGEPAKIRTAVRLSFAADILAQQEGPEPVLGGFEISDGVLTRMGEIPKWPRLRSRRHRPG